MSGSETTKPTQGPFALSLDGKTRVVIGKDHAKTNRIGITITYGGTDEPKIRVTVTVRCGQDAAALLAANTEFIKVAGSEPFADLSPKEAGDGGDGTLAFQSTSSGVSLGKAKRFTIELKDFLCDAPPGDAAIEVLVESKLPDKRTFEGAHTARGTLTVRKEVEPSDQPKVHYFRADPGFVLHGGSTPVTISFVTTGFDSVSLFRNNQRVTYEKRQPAETSKSEPEKKDVVLGDHGVLRDTPSITTVYRLAPSLGGKTVEQSHDLTVQVLSQGWNRLALPQGYPTRLFVAPDFSGESRDRLYGIFVGADGAALHSSATGIDDWRPEENGKLPSEMKGMETSPGVAFEGELWLLGGSCVNGNAPGERVWGYGPAGDTGQRSWSRRRDLDFSRDMRARAGHACLVVPVVQADKKTVRNEIWVLGGYNNGTYFSDVWRLVSVSDEKTKTKKKTWTEAADAFKPGRMRHAAAVRSAPGDRDTDKRTEVWIFGGSGRDALLTDFWSCDDKGKWTPAPEPRPEPGATLASALVAVPSRSDVNDQRLLLAGTFQQGPKDVGNVSVSRLFAWSRNSVWEAEEVGQGWERFEGSEFYMQALAFNGFVFVWSLPRSGTPVTPPRLNVLIPS